jgi:GAF domain-containing protein
VSQDEKLESVSRDPALQEALASIVARVAQEGEPDLHFLHSDPAEWEPLRAVYCAPLRTEHPAAAVAIFLNADQRLGQAERTFFAALAEIGSSALSQVELHRAADARSAELQELLDICAEVGAASSLDKFLERFVVRAASFLGYRASFIALVEDGGCVMRWAARDGLSRPLNVPVDSSAIRRVLETKQPFWSDEIRKDTGIDPNLLLRFRVEQLFAMPLVGTSGECLGILGLLDRSDGKVISDEDVRRAKALAAQATVALESARNLDISEQHRSRAETLVSFALDLGASVELEELVKKFTSRAMELLEARVSFMALLRGSRPQPVILQGISAERERQTVFSKLARALEPFMSKSTAKAAAVTAERFDVDLARELGWRQVISSLWRWKRIAGPAWTGGLSSSLRIRYRTCAGDGNSRSDGAAEFAALYADYAFKPPMGRDVRLHLGSDVAA